MQRMKLHEGQPEHHAKSGGRLLQSKLHQTSRHWDELLHSIRPQTLLTTAADLNVHVYVTVELRRKGTNTGTVIACAGMRPRHSAC
jgi:hypothetical protein